MGYSQIKAKSESILIKWSMGTNRKDDGILLMDFIFLMIAFIFLVK